MGHFDDVSFEFDCPECGKELTFSSQDVGNSIICPNCKNKITLNDNGFTDGLNEADKMIDELLNSLKF